ncbi:hypothetical protein DPMN_087052 [Dreissena polymorpha]|uniref:Uncharacterized protein n=1 Tax=Dreissena polymorpha TaxID=45954 RepID=A0A9D4KRJ2_DREPO|nr:hypothetical protein DPMN_087052 [Dreissena polymorpha]
MIPIVVSPATKYKLRHIEITSPSIVYMPNPHRLVGTMNTNESSLSESAINNSESVQYVASDPDIFHPATKRFKQRAFGQLPIVSRLHADGVGIIVPTAKKVQQFTDKMCLC